MSWRQGSKVKLNVYDGDRPVCQAHTEEDARFIVRACNSHDELLEALQKMTMHRVSENTPNALHPSGRFCHVCGCNSKDQVHSHGCPVKLADSAIAKAEAQS